MEQILIIEDDTDINNMMASALTKAGYECKQAFSGTEAMLYLNNEKFSVIILDLMLPGKSGNSIVEEIKPHLDTPTDVPIWEKYTLTIEEASKYFRVGENKLRKLAEENPTAGWVIMNGNRIQIKRKQIEKIIDSLDAI